MLNANEHIDDDKDDDDDNNNDDNNYNLSNVQM